MTELVPQRSGSADTEQPSRSLQALLLTVLMTSLLLVAEGVRNVVSMQATVAAVTLGVGAGAATSSVLERFQIQVRNDVRTTAAAFGSAAVTALVCWILVPTALLGTVPQFGLAFLWGFSIASVTREVIKPKLIGLTGT
jgi:hypothetical protein